MQIATRKKRLSPTPGKVRAAVEKKTRKMVRVSIGVGVGVPPNGCSMALDANEVTGRTLQGDWPTGVP